MNAASHIQLGQKAEERVAQFLAKTLLGFHLIARNVRYRIGEIDVVYEHRTHEGVRELVFVEVKASRQSLELAAWNFSAAKRHKFLRVVQLFLSDYVGQASRVKLQLALVTNPSSEDEAIQVLDWFA